jgi:hypothetical protein
VFTTDLLRDAEDGGNRLGDEFGIGKGRQLD